MQPNVLTRKLNIGAEQLFVNYGVRYASNREHSGRMITLQLQITKLKGEGICNDKAGIMQGDI